VAASDLARYAEQLAGPRGRAHLIVADDPAEAILETIAAEQVDTVVVGNVGMSGRRQFLLGNIPNRISHGAACTVVIVNTTAAAGGAPSLPRRRRRADDGAPRPGDLLARAVRINRLLAQAGWRQWRAGVQLNDRASLERLGQQLRLTLTELGPTFAKIGQILSTRPDLLPPIIIDELSKLQERVTPLSEAEVVGAIERELGVPWEDVFASLEPTPLAAGTIAQVHRATLETGERVVVKVQRPTAQADIQRDLGLLELLARQAAGRPAFRRVIDLPAMVEHLASSLRRELDFRREAANLTRMAEVLAGFSQLAVPRVYDAYSGERLLVMEEIQGVTLPQAPSGPARQAAARQLLESFFHQVMAVGFFHADPHPGNLKWSQERIFFLDLGMVGELEADVRELMLLMLLAFAQKDGAFLAEVVLMLGQQGAADRPAKQIDLAAFQADLQQLVEKYRALSLQQLQLGPLLQEVTTIAVRHQVDVPASLTLAGKAFAQLQLACAELDPTLDIFGVAESYMLRSAVRQSVGSLDARRLFFEANKLRLRLTRLVEGVETLVGTRPGQGLRVDFRGADRVEQAINRAGQRLSLALGLSGALIGAAMLVDSLNRARQRPTTTPDGR
jgi:predicted unusual protein kinase regulating ubiquinone biosynthesis (AarF/ABC1/UbiB family)